MYSKGAFQLLALVKAFLAQSTFLDGPVIAWVTTLGVFLTTSCFGRVINEKTLQITKRDLLESSISSLYTKLLLTICVVDVP